MQQALKKRAGALRSFASHIRDLFRPGRDAAERFSSLKGAVQTGGDLIRDKKHIVTVGGGTGTFVVLSALSIGLILVLRQTRAVPVLAKSGAVG